MRRSFALFSFTLLFIVPFALFGQQPSQPTPERDQQALTVLTQSLNAAGGVSALTAIQDYKATGTATYYWAGKEVTGTTTVQGRGVAQFRIDSTLSAGNYSMVISNGSGQVTDAQGKITQIPYHNTVTLTNLSFPLVEMAIRLQDSSYNITYVGLVTKDGHQFHQIRTNKILPTNNVLLAQQIFRLTTRDFLIDPQSFQVFAVMDMVHPNNNANLSTPREVLFSSYTTTNNVSVPMSITEKVGGQQTWAIQLSQINFNVGLNDSTFAF